MESDPAGGGFEEALALVPSCALDAEGRRSQGARYRTIARSVTPVRREPELLVIEFGDAVDRALMDEVIAVERECCPSLRFEVDRTARRLTVTSIDTAMLPALEAIEAAFETRSGESEPDVQLDAKHDSD
jgi:hypothetical protein